MKYPRWKSALSYLTDLPLHNWSSEKNGKMELALSRGQFKLSTENAVYSFGLNYRSFATAFQALEIQQDVTIQSVLVLGWGIGSIGDLLDGHPTIKEISALEHDETLVDCYERFRRDEYSFTLNVIAGDAVDFIQVPSGNYDLVCSDIFVDNKTPAAIISADYLKKLTAMVSENGQILLSKLNLSMSDKDQNQRLELNLKSLGIDFEVINTIGNRMYHWKK